MKDMNNEQIDEQIECAIREKGAIAHFKDLEEHKLWWRKPVAIVSPALVCAFALALVLFFPQYNRKANYGFEYADTIIPTKISRNVEDITDLLNDAVNLFNNNETDKCLSVLDNISSICTERYASLGITDDEVKFASEITSLLNDVEWYRALCLMKQKKVWKAKSVLRKIVDNGGEHSMDAGYVLEKIY